MLDRGKTSFWRGLCLTALFLAGDMISDAGAKGVPSGWLIYCGAALLSIPATRALYSLREKLESNGLLALSAILFCGQELRVFARFFVVNELNASGELGNRLLLCSVLVLMQYCNGRELETTAWLMFPWIAAAFVLSFCLTAPQADWRSLLPLVRTGSEWIYSALHMGFAVMLPAVFPICVSSKEDFLGWKTYSLGSCLGLLALAGMAMRNLLVLGDPTIRLFRYPSYAAANAFHHGEVLILCIYVLAHILRSCVLLQFAQHVLTKVVPAGRRLLPWILTVASFAVSLFPCMDHKYASILAGALIVPAILLPKKKQA